MLFLPLRGQATFNTFASYRTGEGNDNFKVLSFTEPVAPDDCLSHAILQYFTRRIYMDKWENMQHIPKDSTPQRIVGHARPPTSTNAPTTASCLTKPRLNRRIVSPVIYAAMQINDEIERSKNRPGTRQIEVTPRENTR